MTSRLRRSGDQVLRLVVLVGIVAASGVALGFAAGYPVSRLEFDDSGAVRLSQSQLAGEIDPAAAVVTQADLALTWSPGDPAVGGFGLLGLGFCGEEVVLPTALSEKQVSVFTNTADQAYVISEAVRVDRWQSARDYVDDVADSVAACNEFFRSDGAGGRVQVEIREGMGDPPITDHVARTFVSEDGLSVQVWSLMAVGDVLIALQHIGPQRPQEGFLSDLEDKILSRIDPADFAPGGVPTSSTSSVPGVSTDSNPVDGGAADETEAIPEGDAAIPEEPVDGTEEPMPD